MKKKLLLLIAVCFLLAACGGPDPAETVAVPTLSETEVPPELLTEVPTELPTEAPTEVSAAVMPLPVTLDLSGLDNCTVAVSLEKGDAYVDDAGKMQMDLTVYTYDLYDMVDVAQLEGGDTILLRGEEVIIEALDRTENSVLINGGLDRGGYELRTDENTVYYEIGYSDAKSWYAIGTVTVPVSADFLYTDRSDLDQDPRTFYPGDFLTDNGLTDYLFSPDSTTVTIENGHIVSMERIYTP